MGFCKEFNERTAKNAGLVIPVVITVYADRSFRLLQRLRQLQYLLRRHARLKRVPVFQTGTRCPKFPRKI